ncbi:hypothetical protein CLU79DRAFT_778814 [Phycomyces nitens]|nr:hypothetical protein CLU79DRAFT_778814 [Phycomyces nitens]
MVEATQCQLPFSLKSLFVLLLGFCQPFDPYNLWINHKDTISKGHLHRELDGIETRTQEQLKEHKVVFLLTVLEEQGRHISLMPC